MTLLCTFVFSFSSAQELKNAKELEDTIRYVQVKNDIRVAYKELDPKADTLRIKKGDFFELISEGRQWVHIKTRDKTGFLEKRNVSFLCPCDNGN